MRLKKKIGCAICMYTLKVCLKYIYRLQRGQNKSKNSFFVKENSPSIQSVDC